MVLRKGWSGEENLFLCPGSYFQASISRKIPGLGLIMLCSISSSRHADPKKKGCRASGENQPVCYADIASFIDTCCKPTHLLVLYGGLESLCDFTDLGDSSFGI